MPQGRGTFPELSVEDNLRIGAYTRKDGEVGLDIDLWYETFPRLSERRGQRAGSLSGGEQQMLAIARALMSRPKLLLCDEPSLGLAPLITKELFKIIADLNSRWSIAVLLVEQNANLALHIAHRVYLLETGRIVATGDARLDRQRRQPPQGLPGVLTWTASSTPCSSGSRPGRSTPLVALGLVVVFRGTGHLNFAAGEMATLQRLHRRGSSRRGRCSVTRPLPLWVATIAGMAFGFALGAATEVFIVSPLSKKSPLAVFVALIAILLGINAFDSGRWGPPPSEEIDSLFPNDPDDFVRLFGAVWRWEDIGTLIVTLVASALLFLLFAKTKIGLAMRAVASNPESSKLVGVPTKLVLAGSWGLSGALAALAGVMVAGAQAQVTPTMMFTIFVYASAAATLGGLDSPIGAVVGGLSIGVVENLAAEFAPGWVGQEMKLSVALLCIFVVLFVKPSGLFGTEKVERV